MAYRFALGLGSNQPHPRWGRPRAVLGAALTQLDQAPFRLLSVSPIIASAPIGPSLRTYANAAALLETSLEPEALLARLKEMEKEFGRRSGGARWRARVLDLDILLWSEGPFAAPALTIPHIAFRERAFVLGPLSCIASDWRDPISGLSVRHLKARLDRKAPAA